MSTPTRLSIHERLQKSLAVLASKSPMQASVCDSPVFSRRECRSRTSSTEKGPPTRLSAGLSLSQAQIERWSLNERIRELESQLVNRDDIFKENIDLKNELHSSESERLRVRDRLAEMNERLKEFVQKEQESRRRLESELADAREHACVLTDQKLALSAEVAKAKKEVTIVHDEVMKIKQMSADSIDRAVHERILGDMRREADQLRLSIEGSISAPVHERATRQIELLHIQVDEQRSVISSMELDKLTTNSHVKSLENTLSERDSTIVKLRGEVVRLENAIDTLKSRIVQIEKGAQQSQRDAEENMEAVRSEVKESQKRISDLLLQLDIKNEKEKRILSQANASRKILDQDKARALTRIKRLRDELDETKALVKTVSSNMFGELVGNLKLLHNHAEDRNARLVEGIWKLMINVELIDPLWPEPETLTDFVTVLRSALKEVMTDLRKARDECDRLSNECSSRESHIQELHLKVASMQAGKEREEQLLSRLRNSIESAEFAMNATRRSIDLQKRSFS